MVLTDLIWNEMPLTQIEIPQKIKIIAAIRIMLRIVKKKNCKLNGFWENWGLSVTNQT